MPTYGYHNTFHTHAQLPIDAPPPTYACANSEQTLARLNEKAQAEQSTNILPSYSCTVEIENVLGIKQELSSPFQVSSTREWNDAYVLLRGTQLSLYRIKGPHFLSKSKTVGPGRLLKTFSLQHAEVGLASDFKKSALTPKSPFAHLVPASARQKLYETDPHLFEPVREHVIRLRLETEQFLLCAHSQEEMLDWVENLCAAIDISQPLEDRSEPRYRSLPRRSRRQRLLDSARVNENLENLSSLENGRRIIAEQERIFRQLYPHLAGASGHGSESNEHGATGNSAVDPETDDLDPEDVRYPTARRTISRSSQSEERPSSSATTDSSFDPKARPPHRHTASQALRYRRRCAPVLLASSPRVSDVVYSEGKRKRINVKERILVDYTPNPPRYDVHNFPKDKEGIAHTVEPTVPKARPAPLARERPASPMRGISEDSFMSFGSDLIARHSLLAGSHYADDSDDIRSAPSSEPPSPTAATHAEADAAGKFITLAKARTSEDRTREEGLPLGVSLLI